MSRRALHWLVLGFTTLWFGVLVPVHNRGEIGLAGGDCAPGASGAPRCHATPPCHAAPAESRPGQPQHPDSAPRPTRACAVCFFIAGLDAPPPITVIITRLGPAGTHDASAPEAPATVRVTFPYRSRAPPAA